MCQVKGRANQREGGEGRGGKRGGEGVMVMVVGRGGDGEGLRRMRKMGCWVFLLDRCGFGDEEESEEGYSDDNDDYG